MRQQQHGANQLQDTNLTTRYVQQLQHRIEITAMTNAKAVARVCSNALRMHSIAKENRTKSGPVSVLCAQGCIVLSVDLSLTMIRLFLCIVLFFRHLSSKFPLIIYLNTR